MTPSRIRFVCLLLSCVLVAVPGVSGAATFISITAPPAGPIYDLQPTITVSYSSDDPQAPLDLGTLNVAVNGVNWTGRTERGQASWTYAVTAADALVAGMLVIEASISDTGGGSAFARQPYEVFPTLQAIVPGAAHEGDEITVEALGLDPDPSRNEAVFVSIFDPRGVRAAFRTVDRAANRGTVSVPEGVASGPVTVRVNGKVSREARSFTVLRAFRLCGDGGGLDGKLISRADGSVLNVHRWSGDDDPSSPCHVPPVPGASPSSLFLSYPDGSVVRLLTAYFSAARDDVYDAWIGGFAVDKGGRDIAVLVRRGEQGTLPQGGTVSTEIHHKGGTSVLAGILAFAPDYDAEGNLYMVITPVSEWTYHLIKVPAEALAGGGTVGYSTVATIALAPETYLHDFAVGCDGWANLALSNQGVYPFEGVLRRIHLTTLATVDTPMNTGPTGALPIGLALTGNPGEVLGTNMTDVNDVDIEIWRSVNGGPAQTVDFIPDIWTDTYLTVGPSGHVYFEYYGNHGPLAFVRSRFTVEANPVTGVYQPYCAAMRDGIEILPSTTRWKPQRDEAAIFDVRIGTSGGTSTIASSSGTVTGQGVTADLTPDPMDPTHLTWSGLDPATGARAPKGPYTLSVTATLSDGTSVSPSAQDPNRTVSLVEVGTVEITAVQDGAPVDTDPGVPLHAEEPAGNRVARTGGGKRVFAEQVFDAQHPTGGALKDRVAVRVTISPSVPAPVPVCLKLLDVDDPDGEPIDWDGDVGETVADNYGAGTLDEATVTVAAGTQTASTSVRLSHGPGDNYRVVASTSCGPTGWLAGVTAYQPSEFGAVRDASESFITEQAGASPLITVWRHLNLEIDSMGAAPTSATAGERNFVDGSVVRIEGHQGQAIRLFVAPQAPPPMDRLRDGSRDRSGTGTDFGDGRFQAGTIRLGPDSATAADAHAVSANGLDYLEGTMDIRYELLGLDDGIIASGNVVEANLTAGTFGLSLTSGSWSAAQQGALNLTVAGVTWPLSSGSVGAMELRSDGSLVGSVIVVPIAALKFRLRDDDQTTAPFGVDLALLQDVDSPAQNAFAAAYIRPRVVAVPGTNQAAFNRNVECPEDPDAPDGRCTDIDLEVVPTLEGGRDSSFPMASTYWLMYMQAAFQPSERSDGDADGDELDGEVGATASATPLFGSQIYAESIRDTRPVAARVRCEETVAPHELGHQFGVAENVDPGGMFARSGCTRNGRYIGPNALADIRKGGAQWFGPEGN